MAILSKEIEPHNAQPIRVPSAELSGIPSEKGNIPLTTYSRTTSISAAKPDRSSDNPSVATAQRFNLVIYGVVECPAGFSRMFKQTSDLNSVEKFLSALAYLPSHKQLCASLTH